MKSSLLASTLLLWACTVPQPTALDAFPADLLAMVSVSMEPWERLGSDMEAQRVLEIPSMREFTEIYANLEEEANAKSLGLVYAFQNELQQSRLFLGVPAGFGEEKRLFLALELPSSDASSPLLQYLEGNAERGQMAGREFHYWEDRTLVWTRQGNLVLALGRPQAKSADLAAFASDTALLVHRLSSPPSSFSGLPSLQALREETPSADALLTIWMPTDAWTWEVLESFMDEEIPEEVPALLSALGMNSIQGLAWSLAMDGNLFRDTGVVHGEALWPTIFSPTAAREADLLAAFAALPEDTSWASLQCLNWAGTAQWLADVALAIAALAGDDGEAQDVIENALQDSVAITAQLRPLFVLAGRLEDLWSGGTGGAWIPARDGAALTKALNVVPEEFRDLLASGYPVTEAGDRIKIAIQGDRLVFAESSAEEETVPLGETSAFQVGLMTRIHQLSGGEPLLSLSFLSPEFLALAMDQLQREGDELFNDSDSALRFSSLPTFDAMVSLVSPGVSVSVRTPQGLRWRGTTPFGYYATTLLGAVPLMMRSMRVAQEEEMF